MAYQPNESGYYPPGAEFDPMAPWNQDDDETEHDTYCASNRGRSCDCDGED